MSSSTSADEVELPSVSEILDMNSAASLYWCNKLGLSTESARTKKVRQTALIEYVMAKRNTNCEEKCISLPFSKEPTTFKWEFSKEELKNCDALDKDESLESNEFTDKNGMKWKLEFYPYGDSRSNAQKSALFLSPENWEEIGVVKIRMRFTFSHVENDYTKTFAHDFVGSKAMGVVDFMDIPSVAASQCPVCKEQVTEKLTTECGHAFCAKCVVKMLTDSDTKCPICQRTVDRNDELTSVRYSELDSFTLKVTMETLEFEKDKGANATLGDVMHIAQALENQLTDLRKCLKDSIGEAVTGLKRSFSEMSQE